MTFVVSSLIPPFSIPSTERQQNTETASWNVYMAFNSSQHVNLFIIVPGAFEMNLVEIKIVIWTLRRTLLSDVSALLPSLGLCMLKVLR